MFDDLVSKIRAKHNDFTVDELNEICQEYWDSIHYKIKDATKIKRLNKYINSEFALDDIALNQKSNKKYCIENIPKDLFAGKSQIKSCLITIKDLVKNIEETHLFENANLKITNNDKIALIGKNGCGKTTLLKMIIGVEDMNDGVIELASGLKIGYLSQDLFWKSKKNTLKEEMLEIFPEITKKINRLNEIEKIEKEQDLSENVLEERSEIINELLEIDGYKKNQLQLDILKYFGFTDEQMDFNVLQLSGGEQTKVQIAKFLIQEVDILILDEPTNHLDINGIIFLEKFCKNWKKAILSISHDIRFINNTSEKIAEISDKKIHIYKGNYEKYLEDKHAKFDKEMKDYTNQKRDINKQTEYINRFRANSTKASGVQSRIKALAKIEVLEKPVNETTVKFIFLKLEKRLPEIIMKMKDIQVGYDDPLVFLPKSLQVGKSDKIGIIGGNGSGKTTLLKTILGDFEPLCGSTIINEFVRIGSYSQILENLNPNISIIAELSKDHDNQKEIRTILGGLLLTGDKVDQTIGTLSGGERAKVGLTKMLLTKPHIIVMDEPTNHLDLHSKEVVKKMIKSFEGTTIIVSHDRDLLESISNKIWLIKNKYLAPYNEVEVGMREIY